MIDLNAMRLFAAVVDAGSFSAAARALAMPKSTLSRRIAKLEAGLETRLLQRTTRALHLTAAGASFYQRCTRIVAEAEEAERSLSQEAGVPRGLLRVTAPVELGSALLGSLAAGFCAAYPQVTLQFDLSNRFVDLVDEGYDLALRAGTLEDSSMVARRLGDSRSLVCAAPAYLTDHAAPTAPSQLLEHDCLLYSDGSQAQLSYRFSGPDGTLAEVRLSSRLGANHMGLLLDAAVAGGGVAILPESICRSALDDGRLQQLLTAWQLPEGGIFAVYPSPRHLTPKVRSFIEFIRGKL